MPAPRPNNKIGYTTASDVPGRSTVPLQRLTPAPPATTSLALETYRTLTRLARPAASLILRHRLRRGKEDLERLDERLGIASHRRPDGALAWIHAASVGEANSVLPLLAALGQRRPDLSLLLTTGTVTSAQAIAHKLPPRTVHQYVPLDAPQLVARFLDHWQPNLAIFTEQEIWPNLIIETSRRRIPMALVNGRMSQTSFMRWQRRPSLARALFSRFDIVLGQSQVFADRFRAAGAESARTVGNLKIDAPAPLANSAALATLQNALGGRPRFVAASTHDGEELVVATAHRALAARIPGLLHDHRPPTPGTGRGNS